MNNSGSCSYSARFCYAEDRNFNAVVTFSSIFLSCNIFGYFSLKFPDSGCVSNFCVVHVITSANVQFSVPDV